ncbi:MULTISPECIES: HAD family hydrolase [Sphingobacterium]|uniref:HAD family hydrolase n=1 Tax=Sphingobacterium TaxID=28453 RepID=UPI001042B6DD|nr:MULTISPECIES: HAD family hydrolase [Sphingobacterium]MCW2259300.1 phosphonatase-like hydrolase [Sphingobacterium kitahiroshimense]NJI72609.1 HAD hydrolase-like protein [Sphingobacterium sp. B16(2022)]TCR14251.1 phosphonatase-like hydrolase [Sphingobacterium sp. JUb78]
MESKIKMVVFDMAGTTVNEDNIVYKTLRNAINSVGGFDLSLEEVLEHGAGKEKLEAIKTILKNSLDLENDQLATEIFQLFLVQLKSAYEVETIYPCTNAAALFIKLKDMGILRVLNTGYDRLTAESLLKKLNWEVGKDIDLLITASDVEHNRPEPDMIQLAMAKMGITDASRVAKIGDSTIDIQEGQNAGCGLSIGITTGAHTAVQLATANPDQVISDLLDILSVIENYSKNSTAVS